MAAAGAPARGDRGRLGTKATGGPCLYTARDLKTAHAGLAITGADWDKSLVHLKASLDKFKVPKHERSELLAALGDLRKDIVEK